MKLVFLDTETTSLRHDRRAWEVALIARNDEGGEEEHSWFIDADELDLGNADVMSLKIGKFYERHPEARTDSARGFGETEDELWVLNQVETITRDAI